MRHGKCDEYDTRGNVEMQWKLRCVAIILYRGIWRWSTVVIGWQRMDQTVRIGWVGWCAKNECVPVVGWLGICGHREKKEKVLDDVDIFAFVIGPFLFSDRSTDWFVHWALDHFVLKMQIALRPYQGIKHFFYISELSFSQNYDFVIIQFLHPLLL